MYTWQHLTISLVMSYALVAYLSLDIQTGITWIIIGCVFGTLIDLDHFLYNIMTRGGKAVKIILKEMYTPQELWKSIHTGGKLSFPSYSRSIFHVLTSLLAYLLTLNLFPQYHLIVGITLLTHQICDIDLKWFK